MRHSRRRTEHGFTLIELVVVLAILGILLGLAVPRYAASGRNAMIPEADNILNELKTMSWAYYQQHSSWSGVTTGTFTTSFGFTTAATVCWAFSVASAGPAQISLLASGNPAGAPTKCRFLGTIGASTVTLTLNGDGSLTRVQSLP